MVYRSLIAAVSGACIRAWELVLLASTVSGVTLTTDSVSCTYTYLLADRRGGEALIVDPVLEKVGHYAQLMRELDVRLVKAVDTHTHADHVSGLPALRDRTHCITVMGDRSGADVVSMRAADGDRIDIAGVELEVVYTPGHTDAVFPRALSRRYRAQSRTCAFHPMSRTTFGNASMRSTL